MARSEADVTEHRAEAPMVTDEDLLESGLKEGFVAILPFSGLNVSILERRDGRLEALTTSFERTVSEDSGRYAVGWVRLPSGRVGMAWTDAGELPGRHRWVKMWWRTSDDEGETWSEDVSVNPTGEQGQAYADTLRVTSKGRLLLPVRVTFSGGERLYGMLPKGAGWFGGRKVDIEGHGHFPEMDITYVYYSDDEGGRGRSARGT